jgi:hypothetical protein
MPSRRAWSVCARPANHNIDSTFNHRGHHTALHPRHTHHAVYAQLPIDCHQLRTRHVQLNQESKPSHLDRDCLTATRLPTPKSTSPRLASTHNNNAMAGRTKAPAIGSAGWILEERHQSNDAVAQELEDFGFSVRNELEWLNEHMGDVLANKHGQYVAPASFIARALY